MDYKALYQSFSEKLNTILQAIQSVSPQPQYCLSDAFRSDIELYRNIGGKVTAFYYIMNVNFNE